MLFFVLVGQEARLPAWTYPTNRFIYENFAHEEEILLLPPARMCVSQPSVPPACDTFWKPHKRKKYHWTSPTDHFLWVLPSEQLYSVSLSSR